MIPKMKADTGMGMKMYRREATNLLAIIGSVFFLGTPFWLVLKGNQKEHHFGGYYFRTTV